MFISVLFGSRPMGSVCVCLSRKVKYLNMKGSLLDQHTIRGLNARGKEVCRDGISMYSDCIPP